MSELGRSELRTIWITGATITQPNFNDVWDSFYNKVDDIISGTVGPTGPVGPQGNPGSIGPTGVGEYYYQSNAPTPNSIGAKWFNNNTGIEYVWIFDGTSYYWVQPTI